MIFQITVMSVGNTVTRGGPEKNIDGENIKLEPKPSNDQKFTNDDAVKAVKMEPKDPLQSELIQPEKGKESIKLEPVEINVDPMDVKPQFDYKEVCDSRVIKAEDQLHCDICQKSFSDAALLSVHQWIHAGSSSLQPAKMVDRVKQEPQDIKRYVDAYVGNLKPQKQLKRQDGVRYSCDQCEDMFTRKSSLIKHKSIKHSETIYQCCECEYVATSKLTLKRHKGAKHDGVRYSCDKCDYIASRKHHLKQHKVSIHDGVKSHHCDICEYSATDKSSLNYHKASRHEGIKYPCDHCNYAATTLSSLRIHRASIHLGIRHYCDECDASYGHPSGLRKHKNSVHQGIRYPCDQCNYAADTTWSLERHRAKH